MKTILFQGDSITCAGRSDTDDHLLGYGYATMVSGILGVEYPGQYRMYNRGVNGNRVVDLYARIKIDILNLKPDILSILIGVNDVCHELDAQNGVEAEKYFKIYSMLIEEIKEALPDIKIMILEPFVLKVSGTQEHRAKFRREVEKRAEKAREVAEKYGLVFVPLQERFDEAEKLAPAEYWIGDGVHPTFAGHEIIKRAWLEGMKKLEMGGTS